jgi:hypothetical protein
MILDIDAPLQGVIAPLIHTEYAHLDANVWAEGCRDPPSWASPTCPLGTSGAGRPQQEVA